MTAAPPAAAQPVSITDDAGRTVTLSRPARRIVAIAPSLAEMAFAAGAGSRLVGVARYSALPPGAPALPEVGDAVSVDLERIVGLRPDLVLAWQSGNRTGDYERLEKLGYPVFVAEPRRLDDVARALRAIGALAGTRPAAERAAADFERGIGQLRGRYAKAPRVRAFYVIWTQTLHDGERRAHDQRRDFALRRGKRVRGCRAADADRVAGSDHRGEPEVILGGGSAGGEDAFRRDWRAAAPAPMNALPAYYVDPDLIQRQTPRILEGAKVVCAALDSVRTNRQDARRR